MLHRCHNIGAAVTPTLRRLLATAVIIMLCTACGGDDLDPGPGGGAGGGGPTVANSRFEGDFIVEQLSDGSGPVPLSTTPAINFETVFGGLTVKPGCNTYFGAFTLAEDGSASITVAGGSGEDCGPLASQERAVLDALDAVTAWTDVDGGFRLEGPDGRSLTLRR